jgi:hypothetical protein
MQTLKAFLTSLVIISSLSVVAQQSGYVTDKLDTDNYEEGAINEMIDSISENFKLPMTKGSAYDTIIQNTRGFEPLEVPTYSPDIVRQRLSEMPTVIPMDYNIYVQRFIDVYAKYRREQVSRMLGLG